MLSGDVFGKLRKEPLRREELERIGMWLAKHGWDSRDHGEFLATPLANQLPAQDICGATSKPLRTQHRLAPRASK